MSILVNQEGNPTFSTVNEWHIGKKNLIEQV